MDGVKISEIPGAMVFEVDGERIAGALIKNQKDLFEVIKK